MGWVQNAASSFIPYIDIFFLPSLWEAMSVVVLEAMEAGKPVVVTNVGENGHVILNGNDGFIVDPGDVQGMVKKLEPLIESILLREQAGEMAQQKVRIEFGVEKMVESYQKFYTMDEKL